MEIILFIGALVITVRIIKEMLGFMMDLLGQLYKTLIFPILTFVLRAMVRRETVEQNIGQ